MGVWDSVFKKGVDQNNKWKIEFEKKINSMELIDLYYLNVRI